MALNRWCGCGRLAADPDIRYSQDGKAYGRYRLAVNRTFKKEGSPDADFINILVLEKNAEFAEKYFHKGMKITVSGRIQTGSFTNSDGNKVYTWEVLVDEQDFAESKNSSSGGGNGSAPAPDPAPADDGDGFMDIPDGIDEELPFN